MPQGASMRISVIIPTHNRADTLKNTIDSILPLRAEAYFELIVVDNNSSDHTENLVKSYGDDLKYVFEKSTSFTKARDAGASNALYEILLYLDDDVLVRPGSFSKIVDVFTRHIDCGVIAGHIDPKFIQDPPAWALNCQVNFNGWSLYNKETYSFIKREFQRVPSAAGPIMAIRKDVYYLVGGFPPDTIGVETNKGPKLFSKLYIGPGDFGLCTMVRKRGYSIYYDSNIAVFHVIPPIRLTVKFWRSRLIGEGYCRAICNRCFFNFSSLKLNVFRVLYESHFYNLYVSIRSRLSEQTSGSTPEATYTEEVYLLFYKAYLDMDFVLRSNPDLAGFLWELGKKGVSDVEFDSVMSHLPKEYRYLVSDDVVYDTTPLDTVVALDAYLTKRRVSSEYKSPISYRVLFKIFQTLRGVKRKLKGLIL